jgi:hypothetical protein
LFVASNALRCARLRQRRCSRVRIEQHADHRAVFDDKNPLGFRGAFGCHPLTPSDGTGTHPGSIGLAMYCGCPRALGLAAQGTAWAGPALSVLEGGGVPQRLTHPAIGPEAEQGRVDAYTRAALARLRSRSTRSARYRNWHDRAARLGHLVSASGQKSRAGPEQLELHQIMRPVTNVGLSSCKGTTRQPLQAAALVPYRQTGTEQKTAALRQARRDEAGETTKGHCRSAPFSVSHLME